MEEDEPPKQVKKTLRWHKSLIKFRTLKVDSLKTEREEPQIMSSESQILDDQESQKRKVDFYAARHRAFDSLNNKKVALQMMMNKKSSLQQRSVSTENISKGIPKQQPTITPSSSGLKRAILPPDSAVSVSERERVFFWG